MSADVSFPQFFRRSFDNREACSHDSFGAPPNENCSSEKERTKHDLESIFNVIRNIFVVIQRIIDNPTMSNSRKANLFAAVAKSHRLPNLWSKAESGTIHCGSPSVKIRCFSSNATSSIHYDNRVSPTKPLNGIHTRNDSNRNRAIPPPKTNGEVSHQSIVNGAEDEESKINGKKVDLEDQTSPSELTFAGDTTIPVTSRLHIVTPAEDAPPGIWPVFRIMVSMFYWCHPSKE